MILTQAGKGTLILDCGLRGPATHTVFGFCNFRGWGFFLAMEKEAPEVWQEPLPGLKVVTAGGPPPDPAEPITSQHLGQFSDWMGAVFAYVLLDTPLIGIRLRSRRFGGAA